MEIKDLNDCCLQNLRFIRFITDGLINKDFTEEDLLGAIVYLSDEDEFEDGENTNNDLKEKLSENERLNTLLVLNKIIFCLKSGLFAQKDLLNFLVDSKQDRDKKNFLKFLNKKEKEAKFKIKTTFSLFEEKNLFLLISKKR